MTLYTVALFRLNSLEYRDLKEKLSGPIRNARNIVIKQSLSDQFLEAFHEQVNLNHDFRLPLNMVSISESKIKRVKRSFMLIPKCVKKITKYSI